MPRSAQPIAPWFVYRFNLTMGLSILHRITGVALTLILWWVTLVWAHILPNPLAETGCVLLRLATWFGVWMLAYHATNGVRHLIWDHGKWMEKNTLFMSGLTVCLVSLALTWFLMNSWSQ